MDGWMNEWIDGWMDVWSTPLDKTLPAIAQYLPQTMVNIVKFN